MTSTKTENLYSVNLEIVDATVDNVNTVVERITALATELGINVSGFSLNVVDTSAIDNNKDMVVLENTVSRIIGLITSTVRIDGKDVKSICKDLATHSTILLNAAMLTEVPGTLRRLASGSGRLSVSVIDTEGTIDINSIYSQSVLLDTDTGILPITFVINI